MGGRYAGGPGTLHVGEYVVADMEDLLRGFRLDLQNSAKNSSRTFCEPEIGAGVYPADEARSAHAGDKRAQSILRQGCIACRDNRGSSHPVSFEHVYKLRIYPQGGELYLSFNVHPASEEVGWEAQDAYLPCDDIAQSDFVLFPRGVDRPEGERLGHSTGLRQRLSGYLNTLACEEGGEQGFCAHAPGALRPERTQKQSIEYICRYQLEPSSAGSEL